MSKILFLTLSLSLSLCSCVHGGAATSSSSSTEKLNPELALAPLLSEVYDNEVYGVLDIHQKEQIEKDFVELLKSAKQRGLTGATKGLCERKEPNYFCPTLKMPRYKPKTIRPSSERISKQEFSKLVNEEKFERLSKLPLNTLIRMFQGLPNKSVTEFSKKVLAEEKCYSSALHAALGNVRETEFPEQSPVDEVIQHYRKATSCDTEEPSNRAAFRLGLFLVWQEKWKEAIPFFEQVEKDTRLNFLHSRSQYWKNFSLEKLGEQKKEDREKIKSQKFQDFPLSYHSLVVWGIENDEIFDQTKKREEPPILFRSQAQSQLNNPVLLTELLLQKKEGSLAAEVLEKIDLDVLDQAEPEFRLYTAVLFSRNRMALPKFRVMSRLFVQDQKFKSLTAMKMYYPLWYFDDIKSQASGQVDPYLLISLIRQESAFNPRARSPAGAYGLMQLLPSTARRVASVKKDELFKPERNLKAGTKFFGQLMIRYQNRVHLALAAYNAGPLKVDRWLTRYPTDNDLLFMDLIPYRETREYSAIILRNHYWYTRLYPEPVKTSANLPER
jgi:soluble lytic murein transglycosylase